jgi:hypothetical protein
MQKSLLNFLERVKRFTLSKQCKLTLKYTKSCPPMWKTDTEAMVGLAMTGLALDVGVMGKWCYLQSFYTAPLGDYAIYIYPL